MEDLYMRNNIREDEVFENKPCPVCGNSKKKLYLSLEKYWFMKCKECGTVYQDHVPEINSLKQRYDEKYFDYEIKNHGNFHSLQKYTLEDIDFYRKYAPLEGKKILDIGSATGLLLNHFKSLGMEPVGIEICEESARYAREKFDVEVISKPLEEVKFEENSFDAVHFSHLIEHLQDPAGFLKEVYKILKPGGPIIVTTPRIDSPAYHLYKKDWRSAIPDHLTLFSKKTLSRLIKQTGFTIVFQESWGFIPIGTRFPKLKKWLDKKVKQLNLGDVICIVAEKL